MEHIYLIFLITINMVFSYHFYNPYSHQMLARTSLNNVPQGYRILPPQRSYRRRNQFGRTNAICTDGGFTCNTPYDKSLTTQFLCTSDDQCPLYFKCCPQKCFHHNICVKADISQNKNNRQIYSINYQRPGKCEKWPYNCKKPYDYSLTSIFVCNNDNQCPRDFKCCTQSCFSHKICSKIVSNIGNKQQQGNPGVFDVEKHRNVSKNTKKIEPDEDEIIRSTTTEDNTLVEIADTESSSTTTVETTSTTLETTSTTTEENTTPTTTESSTTVTTESENMIEVQTTKTTTEEIINEEETTETKLKLETSSIVKAPVSEAYPKRTTVDSNAIDPNYAAYYFHYDNNTEYNNYDDDEDDEYYDENDENK